ncbi:MAG TPA: hypothetical protein DCG19_12555 [Cryomorphaceae bacterium]|nr:hypothetical protein [Owenweeksia sp.]MBF98822.1 hypothetical protein [Owenweeksia sp.]HAD98232.1 hypothetical protein [Cryomorphaceae bacterium]HBF18811.1 hypothetical protein [Cryomorphaceae bacterium]
METVLYFSAPGASDFKIFQPSGNDVGNVLFDMVPFMKESRSLRLSLKETQSEPLINPAEATGKQGNYTRKEYEQLIEKTRQHIAVEGWGKVVISRSQSFKLKESRPLEWFHALRQRYPNACVYLFQHPECGVWMGATPELLISGQAGELQSMSLAGTRRKGQEHTFEPKEEEEQAIVTRYVSGILKDQKGVSEVQIHERDQLVAGELVHFVNRITARYSGELEVDDLLKELHPTPAVGGFPKQAALDFISRNEKHDRSYYSGYLGLRTPDAFAYYVNLRCMQVYKDEVVLYAGGGILADSDPTDEWEETEAKLQTLLRVIQSNDSHE